MVVPFKVLIRKPSFKMENILKTEAKLSNEVPNWTVEEVLMWVRRIGFGGYLKAFSDLGVDGDILLELDEQQLKDDIVIPNGILRKRFIRDLTELKLKADYSSKDKHNIVPTLLASKHNSGKVDLMQYAYALIKKDLSPDVVRRNFSDDDFDDYLREEVNIKSYIHRRQIIDAIFEVDSLSPRSLRRRPHIDSSRTSLISMKSQDSALTESSCDVYVSGGGEHGSLELVSFININLQMRGFSVHHSNLGNECHVSNSSMEDLTDNSDADMENRILLRSYSAPLEQCKNILLILGSGSLDDCFLRSPHGQHRSHLYYEIVAALRAQRVNIIPVLMNGYRFPDPDDLVPEVRALCKYNAVNWVHEYQEACIDKIEKFIRGEAFLKTAGSYTNLCPDRNGYRTPTMPRSRQDSGRSTPTRLGYNFLGSNYGGSTNLLHQISISSSNSLTLSPTSLLVKGSEYMDRFRRDSGVADSVITP